MPIGFELPREPRKGEKIDAEWGAWVVRCLRALTLASSKTVRVNRTPGGTTLEAIARGGSGGGGAAVALHPFLVTNASTEADGAQVAVRFGQVNSETPTIDSDPLDDDPAPVLGGVVSGVVYLQVNLDEETGAIESAEIGNAATLPAATLTEGYRTLATVTVEDDRVTAINQSVTHSLEHRRCGVNDHHFWGL